MKLLYKVKIAKNKVIFIEKSDIKESIRIEIYLYIQSFFKIHNIIIIWKNIFHNVYDIHFEMHVLLEFL